MSLTAIIPSPYSYTSIMISAVNDLDDSAILYRYTANAGSIARIIATREYVVSQIQGAINASY